MYPLHHGLSFLRFASSDGARIPHIAGTKTQSSPHHGTTRTRANLLHFLSYQVEDSSDR